VWGFDESTCSKWKSVLSNRELLLLHGHVKTFGASRMICSGCNKELFGKDRYYTLVCHHGELFYPIVYCNPLCLALDWKCLEVEV